MFQLFAALSLAATLNIETQSALDKFCALATIDECNQLVGAVKASPNLSSQLNELISTGLLTSFSVVSVENAPTVRNTKFGAAIIGGSAFFTSDFLARNKKNNLYDVKFPDEIYPNNLVFALGHLAFHAKTAPDMRAFEEKWKRDVDEQIKATPKGTQFNPTEQLKVIQKRHFEDEASAYIQGWNDLLDAASSENGNKEITVRQAPDLFMKFRYGQIISKSMRQPGNSIVIPYSGRIELNKHNIDAIVEAISTSNITDLE